VSVVFWQRFDPEQFDFEFDENELAKHGITVDEVVEVNLEWFRRASK
jgi:uncharacterized DUF497 family protein